VNIDNQRKSTQDTRGFYPMVRPSNTCLLPRCGVSMEEGCTQWRRVAYFHVVESLSQRIECVKLESRSLRIFIVSLGDSSMHLGVPFIAPRQLGAIGGQQGRLSLPSVEWRTGQSGAPPDSHCRWSGVDLLPYLAETTIAASGQLAQRTLSGAHQTVRCPLPTVGAGHASPADCAADRCSGDVWLTGQSGAPPDSPVNYSRTPPIFPESGLFTGSQSGAPDTVRCTTG
jgi:hypothetical protein